ncbi:MAG: helix-turn-helix domain-containing protein [Selenomonadaceae bacterium]|nr:helix-turn-helix domain-containing protein [Selenomonadaceae bacterium]
MDTARILRDLRERRRLSQEEAAKQLGIDRTTYVKYENGSSIKRILPRLADFFGVSTDYLLGRETANTDFMTGAMTPVFSSRETDLVEKYRDLKPEHQKAVDIQVNYLWSIDAPGRKKSSLAASSS